MIDSRIYITGEVEKWRNEIEYFLKVEALKNNIPCMSPTHSINKTVCFTLNFEAKNKFAYLIAKLNNNNNNNNVLENVSGTS